MRGSAKHLHVRTNPRAVAVGEEMTQAIIDQKDIQKSGGICVRYPVSCLIRNLLVKAKLLHPFKTLMVLDLTYGEGRFWVAIPQARVYGFDVRKLNWVRKPYVFFNCSCEEWRNCVNMLNFDLVVVDPPFMPYRRGQKRRKHYEDNGCVPLILREGEKAAKYFNCPLLVHFMWKVVPFGFRVMSEAWFKPFTRYLNSRYHSWFGVLECEG